MAGSRLVGYVDYVQLESRYLLPTQIRSSKFCNLVLLSGYHKYHS